MTLTTHVRIIEPTPVHPVFDQARALLGAEQAAFKHMRAGDTTWTLNNGYHNDIGQGLPALLWVEYGPDGPLREYMDADGKDCTYWYECEPPNHRCPPRASVCVAFDTAYAYRAPNGAGCDDLHAWLVVELGRWLDAHGLTWYWQHEYTGEWHRGYEALAELGDVEWGRLKTMTVA